jgi:hypothetical protein
MSILAMDILEMDISEMMLSKGIGIQICPFPISPFYNKPPFYPTPGTTAVEKMDLALLSVIKVKYNQYSVTQS